MIWSAVLGQVKDNRAAWFQSLIQSWSAIKHLEADPGTCDRRSVGVRAEAVSQRQREQLGRRQQELLTTLTHGQADQSESNPVITFRAEDHVVATLTAGDRRDDLAGKQMTSSDLRSELYLERRPHAQRHDDPGRWRRPRLPAGIARRAGLPGIGIILASPA